MKNSILIPILIIGLVMTNVYFGVRTHLLNRKMQQVVTIYTVFDILNVRYEKGKYTVQSEVEGLLYFTDDYFEAIQIVSELSGLSFHDYGTVIPPLYDRPLNQQE